MRLTIFIGFLLTQAASIASAAEPQAGDRFTHLQLPTMLADVSTELSLAGSDSATDNAEVCARYQADIDADLGDVMRAGCESTLAQMSALMDNPIGNVAMMFNQLDVYRMEEPESGTKEEQYNYMMLFQFPKKLNEN